MQESIQKIYFSSILDLLVLVDRKISEGDVAAVEQRK